MLGHSPLSTAPLSALAGGAVQNGSLSLASAAQQVLAGRLLARGVPGKGASSGWAASSGHGTVRCPIVLASDGSSLFSARAFARGSASLSGDGSRPAFGRLVCRGSSLSGASGTAPSRGVILADGRLSPASVAVATWGGRRLVYGSLLLPAADLSLLTARLSAGGRFVGTAGASGAPAARAIYDGAFRAGDNFLFGASPASQSQFGSLAASGGGVFLASGRLLTGGLLVARPEGSGKFAGRLRAGGRFDGWPRAWQSLPARVVLGGNVVTAGRGVADLVGSVPGVAEVFQVYGFVVVVTRVLEF